MTRDDAVSPVIGTILMIAATVVLGGIVYTAVSYFANTPQRETTAPVVTAKTLDTDGDGKTDSVRVTYLSGEGPITLRVEPDPTKATPETSTLTLAAPGSSSTITTTGNAATAFYLTATANDLVVHDAHYDLEE